MMNVKKFTAHLALVGTQLFFAINYSSIKYLIHHQFVLPFGLNMVRVITATCMLWIIWLLQGCRKIRIERKDWWRIFFCALSGIALNQMLFIKGLSMTYTIHASFLMLTTPILITLIASWLLKETLNIYKISGLILGVMGAVMLIRSGKQQVNMSNPLLGDILVAINAVSYSFYFILARPLMKKYDPMLILQIIFTGGSMLMLPFCWSEFISIQWVELDPFAWLHLFLVCVGGTFLAYAFNIYGLKHLGASVAGTYIYFQPLMAVMLASIILNEYLDGEKIFAAVLIFSGVFLVSRQKFESVS